MLGRDSRFWSGRGRFAPREVTVALALALRHTRNTKAQKKKNGARKTLFSNVPIPMARKHCKENKMAKLIKKTRIYTRKKM